jgi:hypothetical protein
MIGRMDWPQPAGSTAGSIEAKSIEAGPINVSPPRGIAGDLGRSSVVVCERQNEKEPSAWWHIDAGIGGVHPIRNFRRVALRRRSHRLRFR